MATFKKIREIQYDRTCVLEVDISEKGIARTCKKPKWRSVEKWKFVKSVSLSKSLVVFTGTPSGVGFGRTPPEYLEPGDVLNSTIQGIGTIRNRCL